MKARLLNLNDKYVHEIELVAHIVFHVIGELDPKIAGVFEMML